MGGTVVKAFAKAAAIRAVRTVAQTALSMLTVGQAVTDINWWNVVSVSLVAGLVSILMSIVAGLPEAQDTVKGENHYGNGATGT